MDDRGNFDIPKGSVRSLPHGQMQDIRRMFDKQCDSETSRQDSSSTVKGEQHNTDMSDNKNTRWRTHISPPSHVSNEHHSPARAPRKNVSPIRQTDNPTGPKPTPRKNLLPGRGLVDLPVKQFGNIAGSVALTDTESDPSTTRVACVKDRFESNANNTPAVEKIKIPLKPKTRSPSPGKRLETSGTPASNNKKSPILVRRNVDTNTDHDRHVYSKIWDKHSGVLKLDVKDNETDVRPVSVFERSKMFENVNDNQHSTQSSSKPVKPPPPTRQRSLSGGQSSQIQKEGQVKPERPKPPSRQRSLIDKTTSSNEVTTTGSNNNGNKIKVPIQGSKPAPPLKPPRTGAHDDYIKVKLEKEAAEGVVKLEENSDNYKSKNNDSKTVDFTNRELPDIPVIAKKKPIRPPPPRPRPFSIATDSIMDYMSSEGSDSDDLSRSREESPFYEKIPAHNRSLKDHLQHWDLPRAVHPEPIRRSLSAECIHKAVDDAGNVVYMDPEILCIKDEKKGYDIYVDVEGYAVPNRLVRRNKSIDDSEPSKPIGDRFKSKIRRFKNLFTEQDKQSSDKSTPSSRDSQKKKLNAIKIKVNQAFEVLQSSIRLHRTVNDNLDLPDDETADKLSNDSDSRVDEREIRKHVEYSRSIRIKTSKSIKEATKTQQKVYPQLFEHAMIVSLQLNIETGIYEPYVIHKFPEIRNFKLTMEGKLFRCEESKDTNVSVPLFCFPDAANYKPSSSAKSQSYNFVLTNFDGGRVYGYCRRFVPPKSHTKLPEVICIISPVDAFCMYNTLLEEIEKKRRDSLDAAQELIAASFGRPLPQPGQTEPIRTLDDDGEMETIFVTRDTENRIDNVNVECLLSGLGSDKLLKVFASILMERSVLFCAKNLSTLSSTIHAIISLLYPFSWQHTFIPVLPADMIDVVCSPAPYIIGITATLVQKALNLPLEEHVLIVDIDKRQFLKCQEDEGTLLPKKVEKALKSSLNMCKVDPDAKNSPNLMISEAFLRFFVEAVGHYGQYIITVQDGKKIFQKEHFIKGASSSTLQQLLEWFSETQMFEVFMTKQLEKKDWGNTIEMFQSRIQEHLALPGQKRRLGLKFSA
ncbi:suppression of tumorigenicity 5 [Mactra antiquata]